MKELLNNYMYFPLIFVYTTTNIRNNKFGRPNMVEWVNFITAIMKTQVCIPRTHVNAKYVWSSLEIFRSSKM